MNEDFQYVKSVVDKINLNNSTNDKVETLTLAISRSPFFKKLIELVYNPFKMFNITSKNIKKFKKIDVDFFTYHSIFNLLDDLHTRTISGDAAHASVQRFIHSHPAFEDLILNIIDKDLKMRMGDTLLRKCGAYIPEFSVALAEKYENPIDFSSREWWWSRKLDGLRCVMMLDSNGKAKAYTRAGHEFKTLTTLTKAVEEIASNIGLKDCVLDGELCIVGENGVEDFQAIQSQYNLPNHDIINAKFLIFDLISTSDFLAKESTHSHYIRYFRLNRCIPKHSNISVVEHIRINSNEEFEEIREIAREAGWEGIMLRNHSVPYKGKRSKHLLKAKLFLDAEFEVIRTEDDVFRVIVDNVEVEEVMLARVWIMYKGFEVAVGSGFSLNQRREFTRDPSKIVGKIITVQYFSESQNQHGGISLKWPTLKALHGSERIA